MIVSFIYLATPPSITSHPVSLTDILPGSDVQFSVKATGTAPLSYQWQKYGVYLTDGDRVKGASTSTLSITAVQKSDEAEYTCEVANTAGTVTSKPGTVTSKPATLDIVRRFWLLFNYCRLGNCHVVFSCDISGPRLTSWVMTSCQAMHGICKA